MESTTPSPRPRSRAAVLKAAIFLATACGIIIALFSLADFSRLTASLAQARPGPILAAALLQAFAAALRAERLRRILGGSPSFGRVFHIANTGNMVNCLIPLRAGEFCMTFLLAGSLKHGASEALSKIFVDRLLDLMTVTLLFIATALSLPGDAAAAPGLRGAAAVCAVILPATWLLLFLLSRFQTPMLRLLKRLAAPFRFLPWDSLEGRIRSGIAGLDVLFRPRELFLLLLRSLLIWTLIAASYHFGMAALFTPPAFQAALLAMCLTVVGLMAVAAPAGIGAVHGAIVLALSLFGVPVDQGLAFALLYHALVTTLNVALGLVGTHALGLRPGRLLRLSARRGADSPDEAAPR